MNNSGKLRPVHILVGAVIGVAAVPVLAQIGQIADRFTPILSALETYAVDNNGKFPPDKNAIDTTKEHYLPDILTTPIAYMEPAQMEDPFADPNSPYSRYRFLNTYDSYFGTTEYPTQYDRHGDWAVWSGGPSRNSDALLSPFGIAVYDPTNGTLSNGVIIRNQRMLKETGAEPRNQ